MIHDFVLENFEGAEQNMLTEKIEHIQNSSINSPKSVKWKLRSKLGRKIPWYELPEEKN